ncbi:hypothetical protein [Maricaulis maris]|jgi:hypothetical protein|uniref:hypothetical protein n=1 Tax=Maricaulis maris TaxID=74318 RepID=UPI002925EAC1|nr:hypothetical protein MACH15_29990 [Maricaulis maris]
MKHRVEFDPERQVAIIRYRGELRAEDPAELIRELVGKPGWTPRCDRIVLYDEALMGEMTAGDFKKTAALLQPLIARHYGSAPSFSAHVCVDPLQRASLEYWMALGEAIYSPSMALFDTLAEAEAWIAAQRASLDR